MTLSDYDTAAEKIAALKCAIMDPALVHITTTGFTTDDIIYIITANSYYVNGIGGYGAPEFYGYCHRIKNGDVLSGFGAMMYIKNSDIIYSNPIDLYQNRLARIIETNESYIAQSGTLTGGAFGSLILYGWEIALPTGEVLTSNNYYGYVMSKFMPIPAGQQVTADAYDPIKYFDVPSDW